MPRGIVIPFTADVRQWGKAIRSVGKDLSDIGDDFKDLERVAKSSGDDIERSLEDTADDIERAFEGLGRDVEAEFDRMERAARNADVDGPLTDNIAAGSFKGASRALAAEAADEFVESWGEAIRAGNPSEAITETLTQGLAIGAAVGGPIALAVGAGASLLGAVVQGFQRRAAEERAAIAAAIASLLGTGRDAATEAGAKTWAAYRAAFVAGQEGDDLLTSVLGADNVSAAIDTIQTELASLGQTVQADVVAGLTNTGKAGQQAQQRIRDAAARTKQEYFALLDYQTQQATKGQALTANEQARLARLKQQNGAFNTAVGYLDKQKTLLGGAVGNAELLYDAAQRTKGTFNTTKPPDLGPLASDAERTSQALRDAKTYWDSLRSKSIELDINYRTRGTPPP